jgi:hypothetical protein
VRACSAGQFCGWRTGVHIADAYLRCRLGHRAPLALAPQLKTKDPLYLSVQEDVQGISAGCADASGSAADDGCVVEAELVA